MFVHNKKNKNNVDKKINMLNCLTNADKKNTNKERLIRLLMASYISATKVHKIV